jgi:hypothetical protein
MSVSSTIALPSVANCAAMRLQAQPRTGAAGKLVAQTVSLLYRRLAVGRPPCGQVVAQLYRARWSFMKSRDLQNRMHIGTMNQANGAPASGTARRRPFPTSRAGRPALRFMERASSLHTNFSLWAHGKPLGA